MMKDRAVQCVVSSGLFAVLALACGSPGDMETTGTATEDTGTTATMPTMPTTSTTSTTTGDDTSDASGTGGATDVPTTGADTGAGETTGGEGGAQPPGPGPMMAPDGEGSVALAVSRFYLGDTDRDGMPDKENGWRQYGYDLDGKISDTGAGLCVPRKGADPGEVHGDGDDGIDNGFGKHILTLLLGVSADLGSKQNEAVAAGAYTLIFDLQQLGAGADYNPILTRHYVGGALGSAPKFDGTDMWPVDAASLADPPDILTPRLELSGHVTADTWVGRASGDAILKLRIGTLDLRISQAVVTMDLDAAHQTAPRGTLAGVVSVTDLREEFAELAGSYDPNLCGSVTLESILTQVEQAADILLDATQDPTKECDAVSIGIGFEAARVQLGEVVDAVPEQDFCP